MIVASCALVIFSFGVILADEFGAQITKIEVKDGKTTISGKKGKKDDAKEFSLSVAKDAKVFKGKFNKEDKKWEAGDAIADGLKDELFKDVSAEKPVGVFLTTEKDAVTQILVKGKKKKE